MLPDDTQRLKDLARLDSDSGVKWSLIITLVNTLSANLRQERQEQARSLAAQTKRLDHLSERLEECLDAVDERLRAVEQSTPAPRQQGRLDKFANLVRRWAALVAAVAALVVALRGCGVPAHTDKPLLSLPHGSEDTCK